MSFYEQMRVARQQMRFIFIDILKSVRKQYNLVKTPLGFSGLLLTLLWLVGTYTFQYPHQHTKTHSFLG